MGTGTATERRESGKPLQDHHHKGEEPSKRIGITGSADLPVILSQSGRSTHKEGQRKQAFTKNLNDKNSRRYFIRLANINFGENDLWCTFTWDKEHIPADEAAADRDITNFIRKINYRQKKAGRENIKYLIIPVVDGAEHPHVHIIMTGQGINRDELEGLWTKGKDPTPAA